jgi:hypothetical protein
MLFENTSDLFSANELEEYSRTRKKAIKTSYIKNKIVNYSQLS